MILALDVGNTNIVLGCMEGMEIKYMTRLSTDRKKTEAEYAVIMSRILEFGKIGTDEFEGAIISSVVPQLTSVLAKAIKMMSNVNPLIVGKGIKTGINILIDDPGETGGDIIIGIAAALRLYTPPIILIDMGTATTMSVIDEKGAFIGGAIMPGVALSLNALTAGTSQLPSVSIEPPKKCIGKNTIDCMKSGTVLGAAAMIDGMIDRMEAELKIKTTVIATGGIAANVVPLCTHDILRNDDLLLYGLAIIYEKNIKR